MSREDIVAVASRLFSLVLFVTGLKMVVNAAGIYTATSDLRGLVLILVVVLLIYAIAALLWYFPLTIAKKILPVMKEPRPSSVVDGPTLFSLSLMLLGLWFLANALIDLSYWAFIYSRTIGLQMEDVEFSTSQKASLLATAVEMVLSLALIFGSNGIRNVLFKLRYGNSIRSPDP